MKQVKRHFYNSRGLTLIETLASITILAIVIVSFLSFFGQGLLFSTKAEEDLTAINLAEKVLINVKDQSVKYTGNTKIINGKQYKAVEPISLNNQIYFPYVSSMPEAPQTLRLDLLHVIIFSNKDFVNQKDSKATTEIFGYQKQEGT